MGLDFETFFNRGLKRTGSECSLSPDIPLDWKIVAISLAGVVPLLDAVSYLLAPHLVGVPRWGGR